MTQKRGTCGGMCSWASAGTQMPLARTDRVIATSPDLPGAWFNRANILAQLGRHTEALVSYDRAVALRQEYAEAWNNRGNTCMHLGRPEDAAESYFTAVSLREYAEAWYNHGSALSDLDRHDEAVISYDVATALPRSTPKRGTTAALHSGLLAGMPKR